MQNLHGYLSCLIQHTNHFGMGITGKLHVSDFLLISTKYHDSKKTSSQSTAIKEKWGEMRKAAEDSSD